MPRSKLTDASIRSAISTAIATQKATWLHDAGLSAYASPKGEASFYSKHGDRRVKIGRYTNAQSLADARKAHEQRRIALARSTQPVAAIQHERRVKAASPSLRDAWAAYVADAKHGLPRNRSATGINQRIAKHVLSRAIAGQRLLTIDAPQWQSLLMELRKSTTPHVYNSAVNNLGGFLKWALDNGLTTENPLALVRRAVPVASRDRVLSNAELRLVWRAAESIGYPYGHGVRLLMLTALRRDEVFGLEPGEVDVDRIALPAERTKNKRAHSVPLTNAMRAILSDCHGSSVYVFTTNGRTPVQGFSKYKRALDAHMPGMKAWRLHDLRRTFSTRLNELGHEPHVIEAALNHAGARKGVAGVYNHSGYWPQRQALMQFWSEYVVALMR